MTRTTVNASTVLGANYEIITLEPNNYNPQIDDEISITCTVQDVYGDPVANKSVTLYQDGTSEGTETTDNTGAATWTLTFSDWDVHHFNVANATLDLKAEGWRTAYDDTNYLVKYTDKLVSVTLHTTSTSTIDTTYREYGADVLKDSARDIDLRPRMPIGTINAGSNIFVCRDNSYKIGRYRISGSATANGYAHFVYERK